jgi:hypothetical protein
MRDTNNLILQSKIKDEITFRSELIDAYFAEVQSLESEINGIMSTIEILKKEITEKPDGSFSLSKDDSTLSKETSRAVTLINTTKSNDDYGLCRKKPKYDDGLNPYPFEISQDEDLLGFFVLKAICKQQIITFHHLFDAVSKSLLVIGKVSNVSAVKSKLKHFQSKGVVKKFSHKYTLCRDVEFKT